MRQKFTPSPRQCPECNESWTPKDARYARGTYCSKSCAGKVTARKRLAAYVRIPLIRPCEYCGDDMTLYGARPQRVQRFCSRQCSAKATPPPRDPATVMRGPNHPGWKGGRRPTAKGYVRIYAPDHPNADRTGYVLEHRLVVEQEIGRLLHQRSENVHHLNGNRGDNRPENLELWKRRQPYGVRSGDYHCPGCRCGEIMAVVQGTAP
jgi:hypothetical protein